MTRAVIYARFSTDQQREASIDDQIRSCRDYASRMGHEVIEVYTDHATSGASLLRSGIQRMRADARCGNFSVVLAEALDRLSRNQADIASLYQELQFNGVEIETISEGVISELHIGLTGTMNALFLKELGRKTHRGLKGRALAGKSAGGISYGYQALHRFDANGAAIRGDRIIDVTQADIVNRIFAEYVKGISPKKIAAKLNLEGISGPHGGSWGASTIHGNRERGTGILNNELYIGRQIWNRLRYLKDPATGKRVSRLNPEHEWVITEVPELRIIDQSLWDAARSRQGALKCKGTGASVWDRRRPRFLFSGKMVCGCCGNGFSKVSKDGFGCSVARNKGAAICANRLTIDRIRLEGAVLEALSNRLMNPELVSVFCEEYVAERNRIAAARDSQQATLRRALAQAQKDHAKLIDAILEGVPAEAVKDRIIALEGRKRELEVQLSQSADVSPLRFHPSMAARYRERVMALIDGLTSKAELEMEEAKEALRALIDRIVLTPTSDGRDLVIDVEGALAGLLHLATAREGAHANAPVAVDRARGVSIAEELVLVAGTGFEPVTFRL